jgi:hypothetical protein
VSTTQQLCDFPDSCCVPCPPPAAAPSERSVRCSSPAMPGSRPTRPPRCRPLVRELAPRCLDARVQPHRPTGTPSAHGVARNQPSPARRAADRVVCQRRVSPAFRRAQWYSVSASPGGRSIHRRPAGNPEGLSAACRQCVVYPPRRTAAGRRTRSSSPIGIDTSNARSAAPSPSPSPSAPPCSRAAAPPTSSPTRRFPRSRDCRPRGRRSGVSPRTPRRVLPTDSRNDYASPQ